MAMGDAKSVTSGVSRLSSSSKATRTQRSRSNRVVSKGDWRIIVRDGYAALFDLVGDWAFLYAVYNRDYDGDGDADEYVVDIPYFDDKIIFHVLLGFCILSTIFSVMTLLTSLGRACGRNSMCCNCTVPRLALASVVLEDLPQFVLTAYVDSRMGGLTPAGMLNICSSLTALVNRATTRYDEIQKEEEDGAGLGTVYEAM